MYTWHSWLQRRWCCSEAGIILCIDYGVSAVKAIMESHWSLMCTTSTQKGDVVCSASCAAVRFKLPPESEPPLP